MEKGAQRPLRLWGHHPRLRPKQQHLLQFALKKFPDIRVVAPSLLSIPCILPQFFRAFARFPTTAGQSSSPSVITLPMYVNQGTDWICCL